MSTDSNCHKQTTELCISSKNKTGEQKKLQRSQLITCLHESTEDARAAMSGEQKHCLPPLQQHFSGTPQFYRAALCRKLHLGFSVLSMQGFDRCGFQGGCRELIPSIFKTCAFVPLNKGIKVLQEFYFDKPLKCNSEAKIPQVK